jgi:hypothetical protein
MTAPTPNDHLIQARDNRAHAEWLVATSPTDPTALQWAVTATFYSALHGLTAYLMAQGIILRSHTARARALAAPNSGVPPYVIHSYRMLEVRSRGARYDLQVFTRSDVRDLLDQELAAVAAFVGM